MIMHATGEEEVERVQAYHLKGKIAILGVNEFVIPRDNTRTDRLFERQFASPASLEYG